ncbi:aminotransferase class V-fold PLP-dependent enzyme [Microbulbifer halophilus]|uniref:cysteine desulfurase n=1 Tax=Microbulbifer halophilus TaxID=453963 RepID=A0ABW5EBI0_9GAMM|nr:aminotransferase class V-fold PLP-dependent enzyme [Microbulbifer halophilus]MCW8128116.1 aminotransferase class V-fold PLP-dependent enzyme [Microbulbifer halophilus]
MNFDPDAFKEFFPLFAQPENRDLIYLDNAATTQKPRAVIEAVTDFYLHSNANTHRSSHRLARRATEMVERVRRQAAVFLNAASPREVIFCRGATEALNLLAYSLCSGLRPGDEIVISTAEHHANIVPWQMMAQRHGLTLRYVPHIAGIPEFQRLHEVLNERTRIVSLTGGSNALGLRPDLEGIARQLRGCRSRGRELHWIVDGAQLAAHETVDVQSIGCDFFVCSAHKFYGPSGIGLLYGRESLLRRMPPWQGGGEMIATVDLHSSDYADLPHRFEAGTSPLAAIAGLGAALEFLADRDRAAMAAHEQSLLARLHREIAELPGVRLISEPKQNLGILAFVPENGSATDLVHWLDEKDIAVRVGHHCAQPLIRAAGETATLRASLAAYNTADDVERFIESLRDYLSASETVPEQVALSSTAGWSGDNLSALQLERLAAQRNWQDRYRELMRWGKSVSEKPAIRRSENLVRGCESDAWLVHREENGKHFFALDSDSRVVKGLGALLLSQVDGCRAEEVRARDLKELFAELGLEKHLSQSRSNGFYALLQRVLDCIACGPA